MKTNEDLKLLLFYLIFGGGAGVGWGAAACLFACLVNDFTLLNYRGGIICEGVGFSSNS